MRVEIHVKSADEIEEAKAAAQPLLDEGDELVIIVGQPTPRAAATQPVKQATPPPVMAGAL